MARKVSDEDRDDGMCPICGAPPGMVGVDCDGDCPWIVGTRQDDILKALILTERNLTSLIDAQHHDAVSMTPWREVVRAAIAKATAP